jgi:hypothetical protein
MRWDVAATIVVVAAIAAGAVLVARTIGRPMAKAPIPQPDYRLLLAQSEKNGAVVEIAGLIEWPR